MPRPTRRRVIQWSKPWLDRVMGIADLLDVAVRFKQMRLMESLSRIQLSAARDLRWAIREALTKYRKNSVRNPNVSELTFMFTRVREAVERQECLIKKTVKHKGTVRAKLKTTQEQLMKAAQQAARTLASALERFGVESFVADFGLEGYL